MNWMGLVTLILQLTLELVRWLQRKERLDAALATQLEAVLERANELARNAAAARDAVDDSDAAVMSDPHNRDRQQLADKSNSDRSGDSSSNL
jgi:hypothetical protein